MRMVAAFGIAAAMLLFAANSSRADTCETFAGSQVYTDQCGPNAPQQNGAAAQQPRKPAHRRYTARARVCVIGSSARCRAKTRLRRIPAIDDATQRWADAQARAQDATYRAQQTDDPALKAPLKQQYETAMRDLHQAGTDLIKADPQQKSKIQALLKDYDAQGAKAAAAAGLEAPPQEGRV